MVYTTDETGQDQVVVQRFPGLGERIPISIEGGREPLWSSTGDEIFYRDGDRMMVVAVQTEPHFRADPPRELFRGAYLSPATVGGVQRTYDVAADGQHFLMLEPEDDDGGLELRVILNWSQELERLVPND